MKDLAAIVLCGGKGRRLRPITEEVPKPMVPIEGRPILDYLLHHLAGAGVGRAILCAGYRAELINEFALKSDFGLVLSCVDSGDVSMNDRILDAAAEVSGPILICYGDTLADVDLKELNASHRKSNALATVTVHPYQSPFGIVQFDHQQKVTAIEEKPVLPYWVNVGYIRCDLPALAFMRRGGDLVQFCSELSDRGFLSAFIHNGKHFTVNTEDDLARIPTGSMSFMQVVKACP